MVKLLINIKECEHAPFNRVMRWEGKQSAKGGRLYGNCSSAR